jgi:hypothetical protein
MSLKKFAIFVNLHTVTVAVEKKNFTIQLKLGGKVARGLGT